jgi:hypothetical protein
VRSPRTPALAIAWEFRHRHRWGLVGLTVYLLVLGTIKLVILEPGQQVNLDAPERFAVVVVVPLTATFTYCLAVFSFGLAGDLAARQSIYPARMFTLPVTTAALAGWPMLYGTAAMAILWLATRLLAVWPSGMDVPLIWPALAAAALLAWTQALTWMPYGLPGLRVIVAVLWLGAIDSVVLLALRYRASEPVMLAILAPQVPLAYFAARVAVARARRGDVPDWRGMFARLGQLVHVAARRRHHFPSAGRAQMWFEWRQHGWSLPALVGILLPFELALLFAAGDSHALVFAILLGVLITPPCMAAFAAATVRKSNPYVSDSYGVPPFIATRPMTGAALIAAKLKASVLSTLAAWLLVIVAIPVALRWSGSAPMVIDRMSRVVKTVGTPRAVVFALLAIAALLASTWKQLVQSLYIGLTGRVWVVRASVFLALLFLAVIGPLGVWIVEDSDVRAALWSGFPVILGVLVFIKMCAAAWVATRLCDSRVVSDRALVTGAACWLVAVLALYALLTWLFFTPPMPRYLLGLVAILAMPLARLSAAPLALAWNRHR